MSFLSAARRNLELALGPPYFGPFSAKNSGKLRPYFGVPKGTGGPWSRTDRMIRTFGNCFINPNLIYANSAETIPHSLVQRISQKKNRPFIVYNQNGVYFPGWHPFDDWKEHNKRLHTLATLSDYCLFQSEFCLSAFTELCGPAPEKYTVLHNGSPDLRKTAAPPQAKIPHSFLVSGIFRADLEHAVAPAISAFEHLLRTQKEKCPKLLLIGIFSECAQRSEWYSDLRKRMNQLINAGVLIELPPYEHTTGTGSVERAEVALHLKYKDPCPNAVIERMSLGIPHIYSNSGGTPELIQDSGIGLTVPNTWTTQPAVDTEQLIEAILRIQPLIPQLSRRARERYEQNYTWENYAQKHRLIFNELCKSPC